MTDKPELLPFDELSDTGILWAINRVLFHPRGFALTFMREEDDSVSGWFLQGTGTEIWSFNESDDEEMFLTFEDFLEEHRP